MWAFEGPVFDLWNKFPWVLETKKEEKLEKCGHVIWSLSLCGCLCLGASFLPIGPLIKSPPPLIIPNLVFSVLICFIYYSLSFIEMNVKKRKESIYKKLNFVEDEVNSGSVRSPKLPIRFYLLYWADTQKWRWCSTHSKALKYHNYLYLKDKEWNIFIALMTRKAFLKLSDRTVRLIRK